MRCLVLLPAILLAACASHGSDPDQLEVVRVQAADEPAQPRAWRAAFEAAIEGDGALELWLPLPADSDDQKVHSLVVEVGPPGIYTLEQSERGQRLLHVSGPPPRLSAGWRAGVLQPAPPPLPPGVDDGGATSRGGLVQTPLRIVRRPDGSAGLAGSVDDEGIRLSIYRSEMRATVGGAPAPFEPRLELERVE